ncbi:MAG TPA: NAD-dependent epimerase/dehydratase family protein [Rugosimonospora sp.]|nr:NAD-dependent epimerase/dehydratase family protein [Rugosimonospora sp.]
MELAGERVLVTGGAGFVGRTVVDALCSRGARVVVCDNSPYPGDGVETVVGDLRDPVVRDKAVQPGTTAIVHLAAVTSVLGSLRDPGLVHEVNVDATAGLLELARQREVPRFLMSSTNAVTGDVGTATIHEGLPLRPLTPYGATKAAAEMLLSGYAGGYGLAGCALRLTNVYGPGMAHKDSLVPRLMRAATSGATVQVYGSGTQVRDFVHVHDVVAGLLVAWRAGHVGPLVIGAGRSVSVLDLIDAARRVTGRPLPVEHVPPKRGEMPAVIVSIEQARALGYRPSVDLDEGLAGVWADLR